MESSNRWTCAACTLQNEQISSTCEVCETARPKPFAARKRSAVSAVADANKRGRKAGVEAVKAARKKGLSLINHGAGTMPVDAPAPHGGTRHSLLEDGADSSPPSQVDPHDGAKSDDGKLCFADAPDFQPSLTPAECIRKGIFGGCYFNPSGGKAGIFGREVAIDYKEFPETWFADVNADLYTSRRYCIGTNAYRVKSGFGQKEWESKGWIHMQDPRGWFQWYCRFFCGRRTADDIRQIKRWCACASERGRWRNQLCSKVQKGSGKWDDVLVSPVIRQTLLHWGYELSRNDFEKWQTSKKK